MLQARLRVPRFVRMSLASEMAALRHTIEHIKIQFARFGRMFFGNVYVGPSGKKDVVMFTLPPPGKRGFGNVYFGQPGRICGNSKSRGVRKSQAGLAETLHARHC